MDDKQLVISIESAVTTLKYRCDVSSSCPVLPTLIWQKTRCIMCGWLQIVLMASIVDDTVALNGS